MLKLVGAIWAASLFLSSIAFANYDGNKLYRLCEEAPALAGMYLQGVMDTNDDHLDAIIAQQIRGGPVSTNDLDAFMRSAGNRVCFSNGVTLGQARDVLCKFLKDEPASRQKPGPTLIRQAFEAAFPCK
jgi:Rap1a immunity proteins